MTYKKIVDEYVESDDAVYMAMLSKITDDFIHEVKEMHPEMVDKFKTRLKMYICPFKNRERAEYAVSKLKNEDGTTGEHWDYETTSKVADKYGIEDKPMFYYVLNMTYSDKYESGIQDEYYIKDAMKFINDKDTPHDKAERYYRAMNF